MNALLVAAGVILALLAAVHSVLGEVLIFRHWNPDRKAPATAGLHRRHADIIRASWHIVTFSAWGLAAILWHVAATPSPFIIDTIALAVASSGLLVAVSTRGRHPGGFVLLLVAILCWLS